MVQVSYLWSFHVFVYVIHATLVQVFQILFCQCKKKLLKRIKSSTDRRWRKNDIPYVKYAATTLKSKSTNTIRKIINPFSIGIALTKSDLKFLPVWNNRISSANKKDTYQWSNEIMAGHYTSLAKNRFSWFKKESVRNLAEHEMCLQQNPHCVPFVLKNDILKM